MQAKKIEYSIIKISVILAVIIIGAGLVNNLSGSSATSGTSSAATTTAGTIQKTTAQTVQPLPSGKVIAIGDSFTFGYPYSVDSSWVKIAGQDLGRDFVNAGAVSQSSADIVARFNTDVIQHAPSVVLIFVGTGDGLRGVPLATYQSNIEQMVQTAQAAQITPVLVLPVPYPDSAAMTLINSYRQWLTTYAQQQNLRVIDFSSQLYNGQGALQQQYTNDGKYPNHKGYQEMAKVVEQAFAQ